MNNLKYLAVIALFAFSPRVWADETADRKACINQLRQLAVLTRAFAASHEGRFPESFNELLAAQRTADAALLVAPLATDKSKPSYELLLPGKHINTITSPARTIAIRSLYTLKDGRYLAAFVDGRVEILDEKR